MKKNILTLLILVTSLTLSAQTVFFEGTLTEAIEKAQLERKHLFIDCYTDWCGWCKVADRTTFQSEAVGDFLNKSFVCVKLDMEREEGLDLGMKYRVFGFPSFLVFSPDGYIVDRIFGYNKDDSDFITSLKEGMIVGKKCSYKSNIRDGLKLPDFYTKSFTNKDKDHKRENPEPLRVEKWLRAQKDLSTEAAWCVISRFEVDEKTKGEFLENLTVYRKLYGEAEVRDKVMSIADKMLEVAIQKEDEGALASVMKFIDVYENDESRKVDAKNHFRLRFAEGSKNWKLYLKIALAIINEQSIKMHLDEANSFAWTLYKKCDDVETLSAARDWMKKVVEVDPNYAFMDTYAALLYKTGVYEEAAVIAQKAIETGLANEEKVEETESLLEDIRKAQKKSK